MEGETQPMQPSEPTSSGGALDLERLGVAEADLAAVEQAMVRLDAGTWGSCELCGAAIDVVTLELRPTAQVCDSHG